MDDQAEYEQELRRHARSLYEEKLHQLCSDEEWAVFHRRLHPEEYPPKLSLWGRLRKRFADWTYNMRGGQ